MRAQSCRLGALMRGAATGDDSVFSGSSDSECVILLMMFIVCIHPRVICNCLKGKMFALNKDSVQVGTKGAQRT
jgi:hypothetical protein